METFSVPIIARGKIITGGELSFGGRGSEVSFTTPDLFHHLDSLCLTRPSEMADLYDIRFADVVSYLEELGRNLSFSRNPHLQEAFRLSVRTSGLSAEILRHCYESIGEIFASDAVYEMADRGVGIRYLDGWVPERLHTGAVVGTRAFGARSVHVVAGNVPSVSAVSIVRNAITRGDAIIKTPSNDPLTAVAIAKTMIDMAPEHPLTRHLSVAYWKGGDARIEDVLYQPSRVEKVLAWGGGASIKHIAKYIQPGIDLITFDPKLSSTIVGQEGLSGEEQLGDVAARIALDAGVYNQQACLNARVVYVQTGTDARGLETANRLGALVFQEMLRLPLHLSSAAIKTSLSLEDEIESLKMAGELYNIIGGGRDGAVIVSQFSEPVDFAARLANRVVNLVPIDDLETAISAVNAYTQTIGVYPDGLIDALRNRLALHGAQRLVSLGYAGAAALSQPQDAFEPLRRMCKWISDERYDPDNVPIMSRVDIVLMNKHATSNGKLVSAGA